jgi:hypothetical protein
MKETTPNSNKAAGRRKALAGIGIFSLLSFWMGGLFSTKPRIIACAPEVKKKTIKVLSQDGKLMEVDVDDIQPARKKVSNQELKDWVKRK